MEKIPEEFQKLCRKAENIEEAINVLMVRKSRLTEVLSKLDIENEELKKMNIEMQSIMVEQQTMKRDYREVCKAIQRIQLRLLLLIKYFDMHSSPDSQQWMGETNSKTKSNIADMTKSISVAEYSKSVALKSQANQNLKFNDFEAKISMQEFNDIPSYMKSRSTHQDLSEFLDKIIISFNEKYRILYQTRATMKKDEIDMQIMYRESLEDFEQNVKFITLSDVLRKLKLKVLDKREDRYIQMLRHLKILKEVRTSGRKGQVTVAYIWIK